MTSKLFDGPIPGENYTTDTKNFPWHRPPEFTTTDEAIEYCIERMMDDEYASSYLTWIEMGVSLTDIATMFCLGGVGGGKWSNDVALLIAGPIAHLLRIMARAYDLDYDMGYDDPDPAPGKSLLSALNKTQEEFGPFPEEQNPADELMQDGESTDDASAPEEDTAPDDGLMGAAPEAAGGLMGPDAGGM